MSLHSDAVCALLCDGVRGNGHFAPIIVIVSSHSYCYSCHFFLLLLFSLIPTVCNRVVAHVAAAAPSF